MALMDSLGCSEYSGQTSASFGGNSSSWNPSILSILPALFSFAFPLTKLRSLYVAPFICIKTVKSKFLISLKVCCRFARHFPETQLSLRNPGETRDTPLGETCDDYESTAPLGRRWPCCYNFPPGRVHQKFTAHTIPQQPCAPNYSANTHISKAPTVMRNIPQLLYNYSIKVLCVRVKASLMLCFSHSYTWTLLLLLLMPW